jgi:hypothetical protein
MYLTSYRSASPHSFFAIDHAKASLAICTFSHTFQVMMTRIVERPILEASNQTAILKQFHRLFAEPYFQHAESYLCACDAIVISAP